MSPPLSLPDRQILEQVHNRLSAGDLAGAVQLIVTLSPAASGHPDALYAAARLLLAQGRNEDAERTLEAALALAPDQPQLLAELGWVKRELGRDAEALSILARAVQLAPGDIASRHNYAGTLRQMDLFEEALAEADILLRHANPPPESQTLRAHLLTELGRFDEAVAQYQAVITKYPTYRDAHETLARLLPQIGRTGDALAGYRDALAARPDDPGLWQSAIEAAKDLKQGAQMVEWCDHYARRHGEDGFASFARALGQSLSGDRISAISTLRQLSHDYAGDAGVRNHLAPLLIAEGEWDEAERVAAEASAIAPHDQSGWAWLSVLWRLKSDVREEWLCDHDQLVMPIDLSLSGSDLAALVHALEPMHRTSAHPVEQSPRGGTQTRGLLFDRHAPEIRQLAALIKRSVEDRLAQLKPQPDHPFLSRLTPHIAFAGSWSVRLASEGYHSNHIHHAGWLSSALYVDLPAEVSRGTDHAGALAFGVPDETLGLDLIPRRIVQPIAGRLVVFPSYLWHGTLPFESEAHRLTVAFDALPLGQSDCQ